MDLFFQYISQPCWNNEIQNATESDSDSTNILYLLNWNFYKIKKKNEITALPGLHYGK